MNRRAWVVLLVALQSGCALTVSDVRALRPIDGFVALASDSRVHVEPGYEAFGERVAAALPAAIARVEAAHYLTERTGQSGQVSFQAARAWSSL